VEDAGDQYGHPFVRPFSWQSKRAQRSWGRSMA
jgi:hypothetical protein